MQQNTNNRCFTHSQFLHLQLMRRTRENDSSKIECMEDPISNYTKVGVVVIKGSLHEQDKTFCLQEKSTKM